MSLECPQCGHVETRSRAECSRCGAAYRQAGAVGGGSRVVIAVTVPSDRVHPLIRLLRPLGTVKRYLEAVFERLMGTLWDELIKNENELGAAANLVALVAFSLFALAFYYLRGYQDIIVLGLAAFWWLDFRLARHRFVTCPDRDRIRLRTGAGGKFVQTRTDPAGEPVYTVRFNRGEMRQIAVYQRERQGGIFQEPVGRTWQAALELSDGASLTILEEENVVSLLAKVRRVAAAFKIPYRFADSVPGDLFENRPGGAAGGMAPGVRQTGKGLMVASRWNRERLFHYLLRVVRESGFFLFLLVMSAFIVRWGKFLVFAFGHHVGLPRPADTWVIDLSFRGIYGVFRPQFEWLDLAAYGFALSLLVVNGYRLQRRKRVWIGPRRTRVSLGGNEVAVLDTAQLEDPLYLRDPEPAILLMDRNQAAQITDLWGEDEYRTFWKAIYAGRSRFGPKNGAQGA